MDTNVVLDEGMVALLTCSGDLVFILSRAFHVLEIGTKAQEFFQWDAPMVQGKHFIEHCDAAKRPCPIKIDSQTGLPKRQVIFACKNALGHQHAVTWNVKQIHFQGEQAWLLIGNAQLKQQETQSTDRLNDIRTITPGGFYWKDLDGCYLGCNEYMLKVAGFLSQDDVLGKKDADLWPNSATQLEENDRYVMESGETLEVEETVEIPSFGLRHFISVKMPLRDKDKNIIGVIGNSLDISELKLAQAELIRAKKKAETANHAKSAFIANMSHDIKTPVAGILSMAENLMFRLSDPDDRQSAGYLVNASLQLLEILNEVVELARLGEVHEQKHETTFQLRALTNNIIDLMRPALKDRSIDFSVSYEDDVPEKIKGNQIYLHRILLNLTANAIKFTEKGGVSIQVAVSKQTSDNIVLKIAVKDTGIGIPVEQQNEIFEQFTRLSPSYSGNYKGSGLGLFIVKQYLEQLCGTISLQSAPGTGSTFTCFIPFGRVYNNEGVPPDENQSSVDAVTAPAVENTIKLELNSKKQLKILVVEDDTLAQQAIREKLQRLGHKVLIASTGNQALHFFSSDYFDLIFLDLGLPDIDGTIVAESIFHDEKYQQRKIPIVALSAHAQGLSQEKYQAIGIDVLMHKPLMLQQAVEVIEQLVYGEEKPPVRDQPSNVNHEEIIDLNLGAKIIGKDYDTALELLQMFVNQLPSDLAELEDAYQHHKFDQLGKIVHRLHGSLCYCGAPRFKKVVQQFDVALQEKKDRSELSYTYLYEAINEQADLLMKTYTRSKFGEPRRRMLS